MPFWIKDEAFRAGLTPSLPQAQAYFRRIRADIERACVEGRLRCVGKGAAMVPPMELRWARAYVGESLAVGENGARSGYFLHFGAAGRVRCAYRAGPHLSGGNHDSRLRQPGTR